MNTQDTPSYDGKKVNEVFQLIEDEYRAKLLMKESFGVMKQLGQRVFDYVHIIAGAANDVTHRPHLQAEYMLNCRGIDQSSALQAAQGVHDVSRKARPGRNGDEVEVYTDSVLIMLTEMYDRYVAFQSRKGDRLAPMLEWSWYEELIRSALDSPQNPQVAELLD